MSGILFVVCIPTRRKEVSLNGSCLKRSFSCVSVASQSEVRPADQEQKPSLLSTRTDRARLGSCASFQEEQSRSDEDIPSRTSALLTTEKRPKLSDLLSGPWGGTPLHTPRKIGIKTPAEESFTLPKVDVNKGRTLSHSDPESISAQLPTSAIKLPRPNYVFMEKHLENVLNDLKINNAVWCLGRSQNYYQVFFPVGAGSVCEEMLKKLAESGIGIRFDSVVSVLPCTLYYHGIQNINPEPNEGPDTGAEGENEKEGPKADQLTAWERFVQSVRARLTVAQVVEGVRANASFTFDFVMLLVVAAFVAALGLLENSTVILVASMLISPLMGPVMAATFGTMIRDRALQKMGLINELSGLMLCLLIGFISGLGIGFFDRPWPTDEMLDSQCLVSLMCRGQLRSLWVNVLIAMLSGAGISIALLRDNTASLVGVAISASLLPPAVNAGLLWAMSVVYVANHHGPLVASPDADDLDRNFSTIYSTNPPIEMAIMGGISLCLTIINIVFIYLTGIFLLKVKEVAPHSQAHSRFWQHDVKIARDYNTTLNGASAADLLMSFSKQNGGLAGFGGLDDMTDDLVGFSPRLEHLLQRTAETRGARLSDPLAHQTTWSPSTINPEMINSVRELEALYRTLRTEELMRRMSLHGQRLSRFSMAGAGAGPPFREEDAGAQMFVPEVRVTKPLQLANSRERIRVRGHSLPNRNSPAQDSPGSVFASPELVVAPNADSSATPHQPSVHLPVKKRRFLVTKADDKEPLLP